MSRLEELRARKKAKQEKKYISLETELTELTKDPSVSFVSPTSRDAQFFFQSDQSTGNTPSPAQEHVAAPPEVTRNSGNSTNSSPVEPDQTCLEPPARKDRLCYQCQNFQRSPYGYPLGLCQQHGNRIQHSTSRPTQFGCSEFTFRQPGDGSRVCTECRHYNPLSTMCSVINTGCPYPTIPPCSGEKFQHRLKAVRPNKEQIKELQS